MPPTSVYSTDHERRSSGKAVRTHNSEKLMVRLAPPLGLATGRDINRPGDPTAGVLETARPTRT
jgi:hypothetical protein